jgi:hypothetical protein
MALDTMTSLAPLLPRSVRAVHSGCIVSIVATPRTVITIAAHRSVR